MSNTYKAFNIETGAPTRHTSLIQPTDSTQPNLAKVSSITTQNTVKTIEGIFTAIQTIKPLSDQENEQIVTDLSFRQNDKAVFSKQLDDMIHLFESYIEIFIHRNEQPYALSIAQQGFEHAKRAKHLLNTRLYQLFWQPFSLANNCHTLVLLASEEAYIFAGKSRTGPAAQRNQQLKKIKVIFELEQMIELKIQHPNWSNNRCYKQMDKKLKIDEEEITLKEDTIREHFKELHRKYKDLETTKGKDATYYKKIIEIEKSRIDTITPP